MTFTCGECRVPCCTPEALIAHMSVAHNWGRPKETLTVNQPYTYGVDHTLCPKCGVSWNTINDSLREFGSPDRASAETFIRNCTTCNVAFSREWRNKILT
jgi:hypothetical protein